METIKMPKFGNPNMMRKISLTLVEAAAYGRDPLWRAYDVNWPSIPDVEFRMSEDGSGRVYRRAAALLDRAERDNAID